MFRRKNNINIGSLKGLHLKESSPNRQILKFKRYTPKKFNECSPENQWLEDVISFPYRDPITLSDDDWGV